MGVIVTGVTASLRWSYYTAAIVRAWTVTRDDHGWVLVGTLDTPDAFRLSQQPLAFVAPHPHGVWRWPVITLQMSGAALTARLGPQELSSEPQSQTSRK